jgi:hypothetical protein
VLHSEGRQWHTLFVGIQSESAPTCQEIAAKLSADRKLVTSREDAEALLTRAEEALRDCSDSWEVRGAAAWVIWEARIKRAAQDASATELAAAVRRIAEVQAASLYGKVSAYVKGLTDVLERLNKGNYRDRAAVAASLTQSVDIAQLSREKGSFNDKPTPSQAARFCDAATKALDGSPELVRVAEASIGLGVYGSPAEGFWVYFRLAKALQTSDPARALRLVESLPPDAQSSAVAQLRVKLLVASGRSAEALPIARDAVVRLQLGALKYSVPLLVELAGLLDDRETRGQVVRLIRLVSVKEGRPLDPRVSALERELGLEPAPNSATDADAARLLNTLRPRLR